MGFIRNKVISENKYPGSVHRHIAQAGSLFCFSGIFFSANHLRLQQNNLPDCSWGVHKLEACATFTQTGSFCYFYTIWKFVLLYDQFRFYGINSPLERGRGVLLDCAVSETPLPLSRGEYIKFNVVVCYFYTNWKLVLLYPGTVRRGHRLFSQH